MKNLSFADIIKSRSTTAEQLEDLYAYENLSVEQIAKIVTHPNVNPDFIGDLLYKEEDLDYKIVYAIAGKAKVLSKEAIEKLLYIVLEDHPSEWSKNDRQKLYNKLKRTVSKRDDASDADEYPWLNMDMEQFIEEYSCGDRELFSDDFSEYA